MKSWKCQSVKSITNLKTQRLRTSWNRSNSDWTNLWDCNVFCSHFSLHSRTSLIDAAWLLQQSAAQRCMSFSKPLKWFLSTALTKSRIAFWTRLWASYAILKNSRRSIWMSMRKFCDLNRKSISYTLYLGLEVLR